MSKHTPGSWQSKNEHQWDVIVGNIDGPDNGELAYTVIAEVWSDDAEGHANARLIAAAPELLAALWGLVGQIEQAREGFGIYADSPSMTEALEEAHRVHAKATADRYRTEGRDARAAADGGRRNHLRPVGNQPLCRQASPLLVNGS